ncbi:MAG: hypothetical protein M3N22_08660 [Acidobacteriota bacterium]|nr:hypothetical protein [Acidobacteriota bacterium]
MLRFPRRLGVDLMKVRVAQKIFGNEKNPLALKLCPNANLKSSDSASYSHHLDRQMLAQVRASAAPVVWIGGESPLAYAHIGKLTSEIVACRRTVFIEMDGTLLRRRIHEFRPVSRLYFTVQLNGLEASHDDRAENAGVFRATVGGVRAAKLSGFHLCALTKIFADTQIEELRKLAEYLCKLEVDGWVQTPGIADDGAKPTQQKLLQAREIVPNRKWRLFSELLDLAAVADAECKEKERSMRPISEELPGRREGVRAQ